MYLLFCCTLRAIAIDYYNFRTGYNKSCIFIQAKYVVPPETPWMLNTQIPSLKDEVVGQPQT